VQDYLAGRTSTTRAVTTSPATEPTHTADPITPPS
jgi:hypothetical protein